MKLVFATHNDHKVKEVSALLGSSVNLVSLDAIDCDEELPETSDTFEGNAEQKARYVYDKYGVNCFADDSGLEVDALGGAPGIFSARYAGTKIPADNIQRLLNEMKDESNRTARFRTVLVCILDDAQRVFEGRLEGRITHAPAGSGGFGYDPVFIPAGYDKTLAEMSGEEKNAISHRAQAVRELATYLVQLNNEKLKMNNEK